MNRNILFIGGSMNQTTMMHKISKYFQDDNLYFSPYYGHGYIHFLVKIGFLNFSILGGRFFANTMKYFEDNNLKVDYRGLQREYDLVFTCQDLIFPKNIKKTRVILVQEGMTDPKSIMYWLVKYLNFPRYSASTAATGLSDFYDLFCVASEGYKKMFIKNGIKENKILVTGIPNFDNLRKYSNNNFPHRGFVLVATSDARETFKIENRKGFIKSAIKIAAGRLLIFKLHPNENFERATKEINHLVPEAIVLTSGDINEMIANADVLITQYSSCVYTGLALGKEVHSYFEIEELKQLLPLQNEGTSARKIAEFGHKLLNIDVNEVKSRGKQNLKIIDNQISKNNASSYSVTFPQPVVTE